MKENIMKIAEMDSADLPEDLVWVNKKEEKKEKKKKIIKELLEDSIIIYRVQTKLILINMK